MQCIEVRCALFFPLFLNPHSTTIMYDLLYNTNGFHSPTYDISSLLFTQATLIYTNELILLYKLRFYYVFKTNNINNTNNNAVFRSNVSDNIICK